MSNKNPPMIDSAHPAKRRTRYLNKKSLGETLEIFVERFGIQPRAAELVRVEDSLGRVTAAPVFASVSVPHYHGSAMDGIAVRAADTFGAAENAPIDLTLVSTDTPDESVAERSFAYVDTGHPLPEWANAVIMIENVFPRNDGALAIRAAAAPWQHVRLVGEDVVATEPLLPRSHTIRPFDIGALLAAGRLEVEVASEPTVAILATGSEIVEPGEDTSRGAIPDFNSRVIAAFVTEWGGRPNRLGRVRDDPEAIRRAIEDATADNDIVTVIAGSSAGERDYTVGVLESLGEVLVHGIDIMPGKPAICARVGKTPVLGVPGYPVSAIVVCQQVLRPLVCRFLGKQAEPPQTVRAIVPRKLPSRLGLEEFVRVTLGRVGDQIVVNPLGRGAGIITTMVRADGFLRIPALSEGINAAEEVEVELLRPASEIENTIVFSGSHDMTIGLLEDCMKRREPRLKISTTNIGSLGGLVALKRGEAHVVGSHLLDPKSGAYNLPDLRRLFGRGRDIVVVNLVVREQGLICAKGNPKEIKSLRDLARPEVRFVNRQSGAGTRVLLDYELGKLGIAPERIGGYEREEFTHMAVAVAVSSGLADCGLGIRSAAVALDLDFVPVENEDYDLILRRDFADSDNGQHFLEMLTAPELHAAINALGGYDTSRTGTRKEIKPAKSKVTTKPRKRSPRPRAVGRRL
jgi:putative molybdopterin biosynthesis protein